jgi:hypothetical protein
MQQSMPPSDAERPVENPYAPPRAFESPAATTTESSHARSQRQQHLRRESCIRATGLLCLIVGVILLVSFGLGTLAELRKFPSGERDIDPWLYRRWIARMATVNSLALIAAVTSWGLFQLRNWGRWTLTIISVIPVPILLCSGLIHESSGDPAFQESLDSFGSIALSVVSALSCAPQVFLLWSPKGKTVFSPGYREIIKQTPDLRGGCLGSLQALLIVPASCTSYFVLMMTTLNTLVLLGLIRSF